MSYTIDMRSAARRHLQAAESLLTTHRADVAGYLFGIAAECALKAMLFEAGIRPSAERKGDVYYLHFPALKSVLLQQLSGRIGSPIARLLSPQFMQHWAIEMRYSNGQDIQAAWIARWQLDARQAVSAIGT